MTTTPAPEIRRAFRASQDTILGGVASGLARHLGWPVLWVRVAFLVGVAMGGFGIAYYAALWMFMPTDNQFEHSAPGLESATRQGKRPGRVRRLSDLGPAIALGALGVGLVLTANLTFGNGFLIWPLLLAGGGIALLWRQADEAQRERWLDPSRGLDPIRAVFGTGGWASYARVGAGGLLVLLALIVFSIMTGSASAATAALVTGLLGIGGLALVVGPWFLRLAADLTAERAERVRTQERADMAAHLHDSVLQTLALIQRNADDSATVARLARAQERDLRAWLYAGEAADESSFAAALRGVGASVEDAHGVTVDVVAVGDCAFTEQVRPLVRATGEAITNAAKHAGTGRVDVYAEVLPDAIEVFVRDRGAGFDPDVVPEDRHGVRHSILDRMTRHGGTAHIRTAPGEGTEVRLRLPRTTEENDAS